MSVYVKRYFALNHNQSSKIVKNVGNASGKVNLRIFKFWFEC